MKAIPCLQLITALLFSGCALQQDPDAELRSAATVRLEERFAVHGFGDSVQVHTPQAQFSVRARASAPPVPFAEIAAGLLECAGLRLLSEGTERGDLILAIDARGRALMRDYSPEVARSDPAAEAGVYAGNRIFTVPAGLFLEGILSLETPGMEPRSRRFRGEAAPPADMDLDITYSRFSSRPLHLEYDRPSGRIACDLPGSFTQRLVELLGESFGIPFLIAVIDSQPHPADSYAEKLLRSMEVGPADEELLTAALEQHADPRIRRLAAESLAERSGKRSRTGLIEALDDDDWRVRQTAAEALGSRGGKQAVQPLIALLDDARWQVRQAAAGALVSIGDDRAVAPLIAALADPEWRIRLLAAGNLGEMGDDRAVQPLVATLSDPEFGVRYHAVLALQKLGDRRAVGPLIEALDDDDPHLRNRIMTALAELTGEDFRVPGEWRAWWSKRMEEE